VPIAADEGRHRPPEPTPAWWQEAWEFEAWWDGGAGGVAVHASLLPAQRRAWYWAGLVRAGEPLLTLSDLDVPMPRATLLLKAAGLWAEHVCEEPLAHWTVANEAYGVVLDDPDDVHGRPFGDVLAVAVDLGFEDRGGDRPWADPAGAVVGYERDADVWGEVLVGPSGRLELDGVEGRRRHWWGDRRWFARAWGDAVPSLARRAPVALAGPDGERSRLERWLTPAGWSQANTPAPAPSRPGG
jgi:hypothetical protein